MNQRIRQLALEAFQPINDITSEGVADRRTFDQAWFQHYNQKFAELIVAECGNWIVDNAGAMEHLGPSHFAKAMQKHFGVE